MTVPGIVQSALDGEEIAARVPLGGDDELFVTPSSTTIYRAEGLLSDESIDEFPHDADRLSISEGRRKTRFVFEYSFDGERELTVPANRTDDVLRPVLAGVLNGNEITDSGETVVQTYRFSELTLIITNDRLVKHVGEAVWDEDFEQYHFDHVTGLSFEDDGVATQIVLEVDGRPQRIEAPNDQAANVYEWLKRALFAYHDVNSLVELDDRVDVDSLDANPPERDGYETASDGESSQVDDPLAAAGDSTATEPPDAAGAVLEDVPTDDPSVDDLFGADLDRGEGDAAGGRTDPELLARIDDLETAVARQSELLERQQETIERLIGELRRGRDR